jgi:hypothetical protein
MKRWRSNYLALAAAGAVLATIPAFGMQESDPESLLPPGFGDPAAPPPKADTPPPADTPVAEGEDNVAAPATGSSPSALRGLEGVIENAAAEDLAELEELDDRPPPIEIPEASRRPVEVVGPLGPENWGLGADAFGGSDGRFLTVLMRRLDVPLPSRWQSMLLRRALLSQVRAPVNVDPVDWVAERAWLLLRMGEADAARILVQSVDVDRFTPRMFTVAVQTALATADPAALCPLVAKGRETSKEAVWPLAEAMCAALANESGRASGLIDQARRRSGARDIDLMLAEKVIGAGTNTRRAVTIQWDGVREVNAWRFGLAAATGLTIPDNLMNAASPHVRAWQARAPMIPVDQRMAAGETAAALGVFSNAALLEMHSLVADAIDPADLDDTPSGLVRRAHAARTAEDRMAAMRSLWQGGQGPERSYARLILTAVAAAAIPPSEAHAEQADELIASMLSAGLDRPAARWSETVAAMGDEGNRAWAMLAVGSARPSVDLSPGRISAFIDGDESARGQRGRLLFAALAGLGRIEAASVEDLAGDLGLDLGLNTAWARTIDAAARSRQPGTVALLAAVGMQTSAWGGVPAEHLYHAVRALSAVGHEYEARMMAAEALARL